MLDKQLGQLQKENQELKDRLETAYKMQHQLENELEEVQVEMKRKEDEYKLVKRRMNDFQKNHVNCDKDKKELVEKLQKSERERVKLNEKYIKLSQRLKDSTPNAKEEHSLKLKEL